LALLCAETSDLLDLEVRHGDLLEIDDDGIERVEVEWLRGAIHDVGAAGRLHLRDRDLRPAVPPLRGCRRRAAAGRGAGGGAAAAGAS
jgi:hypothetical protein